MPPSHEQIAQSAITNVFVLMLENHSFDHIFGFSNINGINGLIGKSFSNSWAGKTYLAKLPAVDPMTTDPNHEFLDTMEQLCGTQYGINPYKGNPKAKYPPIKNNGFVLNYATQANEDTGLPAPGHEGDVMSCCSPAQSSVMIALANQFAICDNWFSSIPGPTWPNRLFTLAASSSGLDDSPNDEQIFEWEFGPDGSGISFQHGTIFHRLKEHGYRYALYNDHDNRFANPKAPIWGGGEFPLAAALNGLSKFDFKDFGTFAKDLNAPGGYPFQFTFIEPHYGDVTNNTYKGGSSQHPEDGLTAGMKLIAATFKAISSSKIWNSSLLVVTYDEHGGYCDHVAPPPATPPGDTPPINLNTRGFTFNNLGVRVPAVLISPRIKPGTIDHTVYDHSSILRTVEALFGMPPLTNRDAKAAHFDNLLTDELQTGDPLELEVPESPARENVPSMTEAEAFADPTPLPSQGNMIGQLYIAAKTDYEMSGGTEAEKDAIKLRMASIKTLGQLRQYFAEVTTRFEAERIRRGV